MELRTDRSGVLLDQLTESAELSRARLTDLADAEYLWEPVEGMWSIRRREDARTSRAFGPGEWVSDREVLDPFAPGPMTTIAWRLGHLNTMFAGRYEWTFGERQTPPEEVVAFTPHAGQAVTELMDNVHRWTEQVEQLSDDQLDTVGYGQYPWGLDPELPIIGICWWVNREFIHHMAEVALLRDLYAHRHDLRPPRGR